jgi:hypothetical protein
VSVAPAIVTRSSEFEVDPKVIVGLEVICEAGELAIGGGGYFLPERDPEDRLLESGPVTGATRFDGTDAPPADGEDTTGWQVLATHDGEGTRVLRVFAQCQ